MKKIGFLAVFVILFSVIKPCLAQRSAGHSALKDKLIAYQGVIELISASIDSTRKIVNLMEKEYQNTEEARRVLGFQLDLLRVKSELKEHKQVFIALLANQQEATRLVNQFWTESLDIFEDIARIMIRAMEMANPEIGAKQRKVFKTVLKELREVYRQIENDKGRKS